MPTDLWLPVTPSIRRIARDYLGALHNDPDGWLDLRGWWANEAPILPLHIPAGLAIARVRLWEVNPDDASGVTEPAEVRAYLLEHDPELREAADAR